MSDSPEQLVTTSHVGVNLPEQLGQISAALWEAVQRRDLNKIDELLSRRQSLFEVLEAAKPLDAETKRALQAQQTADKYLMWQLSGDLEFLGRRLQGVRLRRNAAASYMKPKSSNSHMRRTG